MRTAPVKSLSRGSLRRVVKNDSQQGTVYFQFTIVVNEAQLSESIHKEADTGARRGYHFGKGFLTDLGNYLSVWRSWPLYHFRQDCQSYPALLDVKDRIAGIALRVHPVFLSNVHNFPALTDVGKERLDVEIILWARHQHILCLSLSGMLLRQEAR